MSLYDKVTYPTVNMGYVEKYCTYIASRFMADGPLLDLGCGNMSYLDAFRGHTECYGLDRRREREDPSMHVCDFERDEMPFEDNFFGTIHSKSVFEHIYNPELILKECYRTLCPGGNIVILVPDWRTQWRFYYDDYSHVHPYTRRGLRNLLEMNKFKDVKCETFYPLPFVWGRSWLEWIPQAVSMLPDGAMWKTKEEREYRTLIRFSKGSMLLAYGTK